MVNIHSFKNELELTTCQILYTSKISLIVRVFFNKQVYSSRPLLILFNPFRSHFYVQGPVLGAATKVS